MVQPDGTVTDPIVDDSSGILAFEESALNAVAAWKFEPATRNGKKVEQCDTKTRLTFKFEGERRVRENYLGFHKKMKYRIAKGDLDKAAALIDEQMEKGSSNLYEYSLMWLLKAYIAQRKGDDHVQLNALYRAGGKTGDFIEESLFKKCCP
ncbi:MAG: hypothetical protein DRR06_16410 [Gammaproteobacteria bacterium]|nr:MAG: hypothetical protein DRR06_16410 [Gammaproteobacteria bacterium]